MDARELSQFQLRFARELTYITIRDEIKRHDGRVLFEVVRRDLRLAESEAYRREIYASASVNQEITNRFNEPVFRRLSAQLQDFIMGRTIPIALTPDRKKARWARLDSPVDEVWEHRVRRVPPELRLLGRFADRDLFVALNIYEGWELKGRRKWNAAKERCQREWRMLFPNSSPVHETIDDYVRANFTAIWAQTNANSEGDFDRASRPARKPGSFDAPRVVQQIRSFTKTNRRTSRLGRGQSQSLSRWLGQLDPQNYQCSYGGHRY